MNRIVNLTPHTINVILPTGLTVSYQSEWVARVATYVSVTGSHEGVPLSRQVYGAIVGLPEPREGVLYVVSGLVRSAVPSRTDVASPGELVRNEAGQPIGCLGFVVN